MTNTSNRVNIKLINSEVCIEHPDRSVEEWHHVVPSLLGGTITVPLCSECHGKAHGIHRPNGHGNLIRQAMAKRKAMAQKKGLSWRCGRPPIVNTYSDEVIRLLASGKSLRQIARLLAGKISKTNVGRIANEHKDLVELAKKGIFIPIKIKELRMYLSTGLSVRKMAKAMNIPTSSVQKLIDFDREIKNKKAGPHRDPAS